ncbi:tRNA (guanine-N(1)-)-methyltransferase [Kluyvera cryocrescens]|uniref:tRNA (guanine-N(1)-)-methyltransferase n=1 Tax=Kluyvera cryocrescens TaxID=580 RepID=A0A485AS56_KLUCR|nr:tRNA (guanine-N(1)-)-methyltransferase [Kluyvera cryocrescens]
MKLQQSKIRLLMDCWIVHTILALKVLEGMEVPPVLLSGNHAEIRRWRLKQSLGRSWLRRPELLENLALTEEQARLLAEFQKRNTHNSNINMMGWSKTPKYQFTQDKRLNYEQHY